MGYCGCCSQLCGLWPLRLVSFSGYRRSACFDPRYAWDHFPGACRICRPTGLRPCHLAPCSSAGDCIRCPWMARIRSWNRASGCPLPFHGFWHRVHPRCEFVLQLPVLAFSHCLRDGRRKLCVRRAVLPPGRHRGPGRAVGLFRELSGVVAVSFLATEPGAVPDFPARTSGTAPGTGCDQGRGRS